MTTVTTARLLITCADRPGIVSAVSGFLYRHGANIVALDQHSTDPRGGTFFMRVVFEAGHMDAPRRALEDAFAEQVAQPFDMSWHLAYTDDRKRIMILVSWADHALVELLWRWSRGELPATITGVVSNHTHLARTVAGFELPFHHVPVTPATKTEAEAQLLEILGDDTDLVVLARYMQVLSPRVVEPYRHRMINIHHSFLPAFAGASPYQQACERGVKLIGATAHYVTEDLDQGPIIEQDVNRVSHRHGLEDLKQLGQNIERDVLARAVQWHLEDRVIVHGNRTVVFA